MMVRKPRSVHVQILVCNMNIRRALEFITEPEYLVLECLTPDRAKESLV